MGYKKKRRWWILIVILAGLILTVKYGWPDEINLYFFQWSTNDEIASQNLGGGLSYPNEHIVRNLDSKKITAPKDLLEIKDLKSRQIIYSLGEKATVEFTILNNENIPYNLTVNWFNNGTRNQGWYNESNISMNYYSWIPINNKGEWKAQVVVQWISDTDLYSKDSTTIFSVI